MHKTKTEDITKTAGDKEAQEQMVKDSLTRAFDELHTGKLHHDACKLFKK